MGLLNWFRTPREPSGNDDRANELPKRTRVSRREQDGFEAGHRHDSRRSRADAWSGSDGDEDRNEGMDWTRPRPDRW